MPFPCERRKQCLHVRINFTFRSTQVSVVGLLLDSLCTQAYLPVRMSPATHVEASSECHQVILSLSDAQIWKLLDVDVETGKASHSCCCTSLSQTDRNHLSPTSLLFSRVRLHGWSRARLRKESDAGSSASERQCESTLPCAHMDRLFAFFQSSQSS